MYRKNKQAKQNTASSLFQDFTCHDENYMLKESLKSENHLRLSQDQAKENWTKNWHW